MLKFFITVVALIAAGEEEPLQVVEVESAAISLIDDVELSFQEGGRLVEVSVDVGASVTTGLLLARQDDHSAKLEIDRMQAQMAIAEAEAENDLDLQLQIKALEVAAQESRRAQESVEKYPQSVSQTELDRLRFAVDEAELRIEQAKFMQRMKKLELRLRETELAIAREKLTRRELRSPIDGIVVEVEQQQGEWLQPAEKFVRIIHLDRVRAEGFVRGFSGEIKSGQLVEVILNDENEERIVYPGRVTFADPEINPITGQFRVVAEIQNTDGQLRPGSQPTMRIFTGATEPIASSSPKESPPSSPDTTPDSGLEP